MLGLSVQDFGKTRTLSKNFIFKFFPKLCCLSKIDCTLTKLLSERELSFAVWLRERALLIDNVSFESVMISNSSVQDLTNVLSRAYYFKS